MPTAVISDIHGNAVALRAVLADIESKGIDRIVCLGDIIGYGPEPLACVDLVRERCAWSLMGDHDFGVLYEPTNFNPGAESAAYWTRDQFDAAPDDADDPSALSASDDEDDEPGKPTSTRPGGDGGGPVSGRTGRKRTHVRHSGGDDGGGEMERRVRPGRDRLGAQPLLRTDLIGTYSRVR